MQKLWYALVVIIIIWSSCKSIKETVIPMSSDDAMLIKEMSPSDKFDDTIPTPRTDTFATITITLVGDIMSHMSQVANARVNDSTYDYNPSFEVIKPYLTKADLTIGNLETTFAGPDQPYTGYPGFNSPDALVEALKNAGFDLLVTANNHSTDTGDKGLLRTLSVLEQYAISYVGTHKSQKDRDSIRVLNLNGINLAVLNYTYGVNGSLPSKPFMLNLIDTALIRRDINHARGRGADIVLVYYHYGKENEAKPTNAQKRQVEFAINAGADIIIGSHSHVISPMEYYKADTSAKVDSGFVAWGMGNFISNQYWRYTDAGVVLDITIEKNKLTDSVYIATASYLPTWVYRARSPLHKHHVVLPAGWAEMDSLPEYLTDDQVKLMKQALDDTKLLIGTKGNKLTLRAP